jgi:uncharacterized membrane protein
MTGDPRQILDAYLRSLETELRELSPSDRAEIVLEVREHFEDARAEMEQPTEADLRNILERLGPPAEIAAEARLRFGVTRSLDPAPAPIPVAGRAPGGLEIGALVMWVVWWPLGLLLTALSSRWSRRDKAAAVFVQLVALAVFAGFFLTPAYFRVGLVSHAVIVLVALVFPPTLAGIFGAGYLVWKLASPGPTRWSEPWRIAGRTAGIVIGAWLLWSLLVGPLLFLVMKARGG